MDFGPYDVRFPVDGYQIEQMMENVVSVKITDAPDAKAFVSLEKISRDADLECLMKYAEVVYSSEFRILDAQGAAISRGDIGLVINGCPGFDIIYSYWESTAYFIGFWLAGNDAISIFAVAPKECDIKDRLHALANNIEVNNAEHE